MTHMHTHMYKRMLLSSKHMAPLAAGHLLAIADISFLELLISFAVKA